MKRILHIVGTSVPGGISNFIMNVYRRIDREQVQFDFVVHMKKENSYDDEIRSLGGKLYYVTRKSQNPIKNFMEIQRIVRTGRYDCVCRHSDSAFTVVDLLAARLGGASKIVMHSHSTTTGHKRIHAFFRTWMKLVPNHRFACSQGAGRWMYGKLDFTFVPNAIDVKEFAYAAGIRSEVRKEWQMEDKHVYGHVGNFVYAKNHTFLLDIFREIADRDEKAVLFLVGDGELREEIEKKTEKLQLQDRVILTGRRKDVVRLLHLFDLFLFPSVYEGLPVSLVEAQDAGLPCLISGTITEEIRLTDLIHPKALEDGALSWAQAAMEYLEQGRSKERVSRQEEIKKAGYGIDSLVRFYEEL